MDEIKQMVRVWDENPENMQQSYPYGLKQYIDECISDRHSVYEYIEFQVNNNKELCNLLSESIGYLYEFEWPKGMIESFGNFIMNAKSIINETR